MKVEEARKKHVSCVYCLEFPNGKRYVGKTKDLCSRMRLYERFDCGSKELASAIDEFGLDAVDVSILREIKCSDAIDLDLCLSLLEVKYIRDLGTLYPNGVNVSIGGECLGIPIECITTDADAIQRYNKGSKAVLLYDENGDFVREYESIARCAYDNGWDEESVRVAIGKSKPFYDKFFLRYKRYDYAPDKIELPKGYEVRERVRYKNVIETRVVERERTVYRQVRALKYDMNGKFCGEYDSKIEACRTFMHHSTCPWGEYHNGYVLFKKKDDNYPMQIESYLEFANKQMGEYYVPADQLPDIEVHEDWHTVTKFPSVNKGQLCVDGKYTNIKHQFKVYQCKMNGEVIAEFNSIRDAAHETGIAYCQIYNCLKGKTKKAAGYLWKKDEE